MVMNYSGYNNYGYNPQQPQYPQYQNLYNPQPSIQTQSNVQQQTQAQPQAPSFTTTFVSNIAEAIATKPDVTGKPLFFYNKADEEIYLKQYDATGAAPVKAYKLVVEKKSNNEPEKNPVMESIKVLDDKLNDIKKLLTPEIAVVERERGNKKQQ